MHQTSSAFARRPGAAGRNAPPRRGNAITGFSRVLRQEIGAVMPNGPSGAGLGKYDNAVLPSRRIRVAQVINGLTLGGGGQVMHVLARGIDRTRFDLDFYCVIEGGPVAREIRDLGFNVTVIPLWDHRRLLPYRVSRILELAGHLRRGQYDIVHTHLFQADVAGRVAALLGRRPCIVKTLHNMGTWKSKRHLLVDNVLGRLTDKVVCVSEHQRRSALAQEGLPPAKTMTIQHGVDVARFSTRVDRERLLAQLELRPTRRTVGTVGRLIPEKGHAYLFDAVPHILARHPDVQFLIVGGGPLQEAMTEQLRHAPYGDRVRITGLREDVPALLSVMDVFVFPSVSEAFGIAPVEAMAAGAPVACSALPVLEEIVEDNVTGLLFHPQDAQSLARAVIRLLDDESLRRRVVERAYTQVLDTLSETRMIRAHERLYLELVARHAHRRADTPEGGDPCQVG
jgi:glycosyltransferase involved in cell wall biosynthesis